MEPLDRLVAELNDVFSAESCCVEDFKAAVAAYSSSSTDWKQYALADDCGGYTRNFVSDGDKNLFNVLLLVWPEGAASSIHDHAGSHCCLKVLQGSLQEVLYTNPKQTDTFEEVKRHDLPTDTIGYINDTIGLHRMVNTSHTTPAVSLHIYSPPFQAACTYDSNGVRHQGSPMTFYSRSGQLVAYHFEKTPESSPLPQ